ncbi:hypothetical protein [Paenibacillus tundrae]|uniref:hypothetical protein n=1 Tax=Paenibacillus tundrae TaxID=528187 RepID=UPI003F9666FE
MTFLGRTPYGVALRIRLGISSITETTGVALRMESHSVFRLINVLYDTLLGRTPYGPSVLL